jgi:Txe/YoeB family toxin of Txe-Axe toxin-antitoxin module
MIIPFKVEICFHYTSNLVLSHSTLSLLSSKLVTITVQKFLVMSEPIEEILDHESTHRQGEPQPPKSDLVDTFQLFKSYLDFKLVDLKQDLISEEDNFSQKVKDDVNQKFNKEGNKIQFLFNEDILNGLHKLQKQVTKPIAIDTIAYLVSKVKIGYKLIKIADTSTGGWATVREYEANSIADNSDDDKKIKQADSRAAKAIKEKSKSRPRPYPVPQKPETAPNPVFAESYSRRSVQQPPFRGSNARRGPCEWDICFACKEYGHWKVNCPNTNTFNSGLAKKWTGSGYQRPNRF